MDLYSRVGADQHVDPNGTRYAPDPETGAFHFPDEVSDLIGGFAVRGKKLWESETERAERMHGLDLARRRDPATMLTMQEENVALMRQLTQLTAQLAAFQLGQAVPAAPPSPAEAPASEAPGPEPEAAPAGPGPSAVPAADAKPVPAKPARTSKPAAAAKTAA
jgi:hypothetical protein